MSRTGKTLEADSKSAQTADKARRLPWVALVYAVSGFCALIYQTVWISKFSTVFGSTVFASSVVIAVFFGGMALGNVLFGRLSIRSKRPVWLFAILQFGIGLYAAAFPLLIALSEHLYAASYSFASAGLLQATTVRSALALLILIVPTTLMGGTFPLLARHLVRHMQEIGRKTGLLYGVNALGGAAGAVASAFFFLRHLGESNTNLLAAGLSVAAGVAALAISRGSQPNAAKTVEEPDQDTPETPVTPKGRVRLVMACFAISGLIGMAYEIYWLRYLAIIIGDTIYLYTGIVAVFVAGIGLGSVLLAGMASRSKRPLALFGMIELGTGVFTVLAIHVAALAFEPITQSVKGHGALLQLLLFALLFIPAFLMGAKFPVVARLVAPDVRGVGNQTGKAYALNTIGALAGLLLSGFCFFPLFGLQGTLFLLFAGSMLTATLLLRADPGLGKPILAAGPLLLAGLLPLLSSTILGGKLPHILLEKMTSSGADTLVEVREGLVGTTSVIQSPGGGYTLYENGVVIGGAQRGNFKTGGYIPVLMQREPPKRVLSLAFGAGVSSYPVRSLPSLELITCVDISRENIEAALKYFPENEGLEDDKRAEIVVADAYNFVKYSKDTYDLILMEPTPPMFSFRCASLYTAEYYAHVAERLNPSGLFTQVIPLGNLSSPEARGIMQTFASAFAECLLWFNGLDCVMIGSREKITVDAQLIVERLQNPEIRDTLARTSAHKFHLPANFIAGLLLTTDDFKRVASKGVVYRDDRSDLKYSAGQENSSGVIEEIHEMLTPWGNLEQEVFVYQDLRESLGQLVGLREVLMLSLYKGEERSSRLLRYIGEFSQQKATDYQALIAELRAKETLSAVERQILKDAESQLARMPSETPGGP